MDEQDVVHPHNGILFSLKKGNSDTCYKMDERWGHHARWNKPVIKYKYCVIPLEWAIYSSQSHKDRKYNGDCQGLGVVENWELLFNGCRVSILQDEKSYRVDGGNGCITKWMNLIFLKCTLKIVKMPNFMLCIFYHNEKNFLNNYGFHDPSLQAFKIDIGNIWSDASCPEKKGKIYSLLSGFLITMPSLSSPFSSISSLSPSYLKLLEAPLLPLHSPDSAGPHILWFSLKVVWRLLFVNTVILGKPLIFTEMRSSSCFCPYEKLSWAYMRKLNPCPPCCHLYRPQSPALTPLHGNGLFMSLSHTLWAPEG